MISRLKKKSNGTYYCDNCMICQPEPPQTNCIFCGNWFANWENIIIKDYLEKEELKNESNIHRGD